MAQQQIVTANFPLDEMGRAMRPMPVYSVGFDGSAQTSLLQAGTDRSGTANTTASTLAPANTSRNFLSGQNVGANNIWINEVGGTAAANTAGSYKVIPGNAFNVQTNRAVSVIAETGPTAYTATEG
jgi:hypothetical protein